MGLNQGKGIFLLRSRQEIDNLLAERDAKKETSKYTSRAPMCRIVQRYMITTLPLKAHEILDPHWNKTLDKLLPLVTINNVSFENECLL